MTSATSTDRRSPSPARDAPSERHAVWLAAAGPLAWFLQLNVGVALLSSACFEDRARLGVLPGEAGWMPMVAGIVTGLCAVAAGAAAYFSWRTFSGLRERPTVARPQREVGPLRFVSLWGIIFGVGAAGVALLNLLSMLGVPPCRA